VGPRPWISPSRRRRYRSITSLDRAGRAEGARHARATALKAVPGSTAFRQSTGHAGVIACAPHARSAGCAGGPLCGRGKAPRRSRFPGWSGTGGAGRGSRELRAVVDVVAGLVRLAAGHGLEDGRRAGRVAGRGPRGWLGRGSGRRAAARAAVAASTRAACGCGRARGGVVVRSCPADPSLSSHVSHMS